MNRIKGAKIQQSEEPVMTDELQLPIRGNKTFYFCGKQNYYNVSAWVMGCLIIDGQSAVTGLVRLNISGFQNRPE